MVGNVEINSCTVEMRNLKQVIDLYYVMIHF